MCSRSPASIWVEPRGSSASSSRTSTLTRASRGQAELVDHPARRSRRSGSTGNSSTSAPSCWIVPTSTSGRGSGRLVAGHPQSARERLERRALEQRRDQHDEEDEVEEPVGAGDALDDREGGEHHRQRAAQAGPADQRDLAERVAARRACASHAATGRATNSSTAVRISPSERHVAELAREDEQPERQEQGDLRHPGHPGVEVLDRALARDARASQRQSGQVDGQEAGAVQHVGQPEGDAGGRDRGHGVEARSVANDDPLERRHRGPARRRRRPRRRSAAR